MIVNTNVNAENESVPVLISMNAISNAKANTYTNANANAIELTDLNAVPSQITFACCMPLVRNLSFTRDIVILTDFHENSQRLSIYRVRVQHNIGPESDVEPRFNPCTYNTG